MTTPALARAHAPEPSALHPLVRMGKRVRSDLPLAALDIALVASAYLGVLLMRFDGAVPAVYWERFRWFLPCAVAVQLLMNWMWGLYGQMWRHASVQEARRVLCAGACAAAVVAAAFLVHQRVVPGSVVLLGAAVATMLSGGLRFHARLFAFRRSGSDAVRVVVIGAGESGAAIVREMLRAPENNLLPVAVLDDDRRKHGRRLAGIPIIGGLERMGTAVDDYHAEQALLAIPSAHSAFVRQVVNAADAAGLTLKVLPSVRELVDGDVSVRDVRDVSIGDLLGREQVETDLRAVRGILTGRRVLITGAGGSIGSEIARQVDACQPGRLVLLDHDETHLFDVAATVGDRCVQVLADVRDAHLVDAIFARHRPDVVFHAAAHKHVPLLEAHPSEAVATNVVGTLNVVDAAARHDTERLVFVSTDKAVRPSSVMGASKALGEQLLLARAPANGRFCAVRFGNVLGSRGSVIPTFVRQIQEGGPLTVTDPRMSRFFMSIPEAVQLVLQAGAFSAGGEIFMLEMGRPVRILELAERMIRLSGRRVGLDVAIRITGMRPGEKLAEELHAPGEDSTPTAHSSIVALRPNALPTERLSDGVANLIALTRRREDQAVADLLFELVGEPRRANSNTDSGDVTRHLDTTWMDVAWSPSST